MLLFLPKQKLCSHIQKLFPPSLLGIFSSLHNIIKFKPDEFKLIPKTLLATWFQLRKMAMDVACLEAKKELENHI